MALRLLHFADLHLDHSFAGERLYGVGARERRDDLRAALQRIVERAQQSQADLITCAGDLFEQDHVTRETANFVIQTLGSAGIPILIAPGHADPAVASSPYRYLRWPSNVTIAAHEELRPYRFGDVSVWASGFMRADAPEAPLREFAGRGSGLHLLLLHGSDMTEVPAGTTPSKPILPAQVEEAGFLHALLGHYHGARSDRLITYPGSPEPLGWRETGRHCTALASIDDQGEVRVVLEDINRRKFSEDTIDVSGMNGVEDLRHAMAGLRQAKELDGAVIRAILVGERTRSFKLDPEVLAGECQDGFAYVEFHDRTRVAHDVEAVAQEFTSRGEMVRKLVDRKGDSRQDDEVAGRALQLALDAFEE